MRDAVDKCILCVVFINFLAPLFNCVFLAIDIFAKIPRSNFSCVFFL